MSTPTSRRMSDVDVSAADLEQQIAEVRAHAERHLAERGGTPTPQHLDQWHEWLDIDPDLRGRDYNQQPREAGVTDRELPDAPAGPLATEPAVYLSHADGVALLAGLLESAGVELGDYDQRIISWLACWEGGTVLTVASLLRRVAEAGEQR